MTQRSKFVPLKLSFIFTVMILLLVAVASTSAAPTCLTGSLASTDGLTATGTVANNCSEAYEVQIISIAQFANPDGTFYTDVYDGPYSTVVNSGNSSDLSVGLGDCTTKVFLYINDNVLDPNNVLARQVFNAKKGYCTPDQPPSNPGTGTPGYWKNHPDAWPVDSITIGGNTYTRDEAITWMKKPVRGDKTLTMFPALVSAKLNTFIDNDASCVSGTIAAADAWMADHPVGSRVRASSDTWKTGEPLYWTLDDYNNGLLCAPHRD